MMYFYSSSVVKSFKLFPTSISRQSLSAILIMLLNWSGPLRLASSLISFDKSFLKYCNSLVILLAVTRDVFGKPPALAAAGFVATTLSL